MRRAVLPQFYGSAAGRLHSTWLRNITDDPSFDMGLTEAKDAKLRINLSGGCWLCITLHTLRDARSLFCCWFN